MFEQAPLDRINLDAILARYRSSHSTLDARFSSNRHPKGRASHCLSNGLLLRSDLHTLFDLRLLAVDPDTLTVLLSPKLKDTCYGELDRQPLLIARRNRHILDKRALKGRCERREYSISEDLSWFHKSWKWPGLLSVARVRRVVQRDKTGPQLTEIHYYLCSIPADAKRLAALVRGHWSVENRCHWVLDVVFGEDHSQVRDPAAAHNLPILREMALKALRNETSKGSLRSKRKRASLDPSFRLGLLLALQA